MVKRNLDLLDIPYEEKPGGFHIEGDWIDPSIFELSESESEDTDVYRPRTPSRFNCTFYPKRELTYLRSKTWRESLKNIQVA